MKQIGWMVVALCALGAPHANAETTPAQVADRFAEALRSGDGDSARLLLDPQVLVYETGGQEASRAEYASGHLFADMKFLSAVKSTTVSRQEESSGDLAWVATRTRLTGTYRGKPVDLFSTESLVLKRGTGGWRIVHIHWSSAPANPKPKN